MACLPGALWGAMKPRGRRRQSTKGSNDNPGAEDRRLTAEEKGKSRAIDLLVDHVDMSPDGEGRGKRVKKKRRLSVSGEVDPNEYDDLGGIRKPMRRVSKMDISLNGDSERLNSAGERAFHARIEANNQRPRLTDMSGSCPVWAHSKKALEAAVEYLRQPVKSIGASVEVGAGGMARAVLLEGQAPDQHTYWRMDSSGGTILTSM